MRRPGAPSGPWGQILFLAPLFCFASIGVFLFQPAAGTTQPFELTIDAPPALADAAARLKALDSASLEVPLSRAGLHLPGRVRVFLVDSGDPRARGVPSWIVARAFGTDTVVLFPDRTLRYPYDSLGTVLLHEIVHLALNTRAGGRPLPRWFHEGVAVSVESGWGIGSQARLLLAAARSPRIDDVAVLFASDAAAETETAYLLSAALVEDVRRRYGLAIPGVIAARVADGESFDAAFRAATGESVDGAAAHAWRVYRGLRWVPVLTGATGLWGGILVLAALAFIVRLHRRRNKQWQDEEDGPGEEIATLSDDGDDR
jgi:hypothetical protein